MLDVLEVELVEAAGADEAPDALAEPELVELVEFAELAVEPLAAALDVEALTEAAVDVLVAVEAGAVACASAVNRSSRKVPMSLRIVDIDAGAAEAVGPEAVLPVEDVEVEDEPPALAEAEALEGDAVAGEAVDAPLAPAVPGNSPICWKA